MNVVDGMVFNIISKHVTDNLIRPGSTLYCDNYFTTHSLIKKLEAIGIHFIGTVKTNFIPPNVRNHPSVVEFKRRSRRTFDENTVTVTCPSLCFDYDGIYYTYINDNNRFCIATNNEQYIDLGFAENDASFAFRHRQEIGNNVGHSAKRRIPLIVDMYNYRMNSVDVLEQYMESYNRNQKHESWKLHLYNHAFQLMAVVAYKMYLANQPTSPIKHHEFNNKLLCRCYCKDNHLCVVAK